MLMTRDGLHFVDITKVAAAPRPAFTVSNLDIKRSIMVGKEVREAIEFEKDQYIVCCYDDKFIHFAQRKVTGDPLMSSIQNPTGGEYYRNLMKVSGYQAIKKPYVFMRDDVGISLVNTHLK
jgi:hypothetical protein